MNNFEKPPLDELVHIGVKGMHWGKHKRVESVDVTNAKKNIVDQKQNLKNQLKKQNRESLYGLTIASPKTVKAVADASREHEYAKHDLGEAKILSKVNSKEKSKAQLSAEQKYKAKGMSDDEAAVAAYKNVKTKRVLAVVGTVAITAAVGYGAYKLHDSKVDKIIKSGTKLQHITADSSESVRDAFYSSKNGLDKIKYKGLYGDQLTKSHGEAFKKEIGVLADIKQASASNAHKALSELVKNDPEFASKVKTYIDNDVPLGAAYTLKSAKAKASLKNGLVDKNVYEVFNAALVDHSPEMQPLTDKYFKVLSEKGYNAIKDVNDSKYSGYKALNPIIAFNTQGKVNVMSVEKLAAEEVQKGLAIGYGHILGSELAKNGAIIAGAIMGKNVIASSSKQKKEFKLVDQYRKANPGTKLTNTEIVRTIERSK